MRACADPRRPHGWIDDEFVTAYVALHRLGWAHSVETWRDETARRRTLRSRDRRALRGRVEVPPRARRVEGRARGARRPHARRWRHPARRAVDDAAPRVARRGRRAARRVPPAGSKLRSPGRSSTCSRRCPSSVRGMDEPTEDMVVYLNPVCSKSRGAVEILQDEGADVEVIEYLKAAPESRRSRAHRRRDPGPAVGAGPQGQALQGARSRRGRLRDQGAGRRRAARAPRAHGAPGRVPRRPCAHLSPEREGARAPRLTMHATCVSTPALYAGY